MTDHTGFHRLPLKTDPYYYSFRLDLTFIQCINLWYLNQFFTVYIPPCHHIVKITLHNWRVCLRWASRKHAKKTNPLPCVVVSCLWRGMQAGRGLAHHWRQPIQYLSGGGQSAPVLRGPPNPQAQSLFQPHQESAAGTPSAVLQPTA